MRKTDARLTSTGNASQVTTSPNRSHQRLELKEYDIYRGLSSRTIARLNFGVEG